jgi:hypothetical protein
MKNLSLLILMLVLGFYSQGQNQSDLYGKWKAHILSGDTVKLTLKRTDKKK